MKKNNKIPTLKVGVRKVTTILLWGLLTFSLLFAMYKNFTAVSTNTITEQEYVYQEVIDTNHIESFIEEFAYTFYAWEQDQTSLETRQQQLSNYLTDELLQLNKDNIRHDIPTTSEVTRLQIWNVKQIDDNSFKVKYSVIQNITENGVTTSINSTYELIVYSYNSDIVIITNPTITSDVKKSDYKPEIILSDNNIDVDIKNEIDEFLQSFFAI